MYIKKILPLLIIILVILGGLAVWLFSKEDSGYTASVSSFEECVAEGNPIMESYPRQCRHADQTFVEYIGNELEKADLIRLETPRPNEVVSSPLVIKGEARGNWFFEASFPVSLTNWDGLIIAEGIATAKGEWMTEAFVPFEAMLEFVLEENSYSNRGTLILQKDNPSGLPENDDALEIPVILSESSGQKTACTAEAKLCPDGSYVGRAGANCEFSPCPTAGTSCTKNSDCPSEHYVCQETQGAGTSCPDNDPSCVPTHTIIQGECKLQEGSQCSAGSDCVAGNVCHKNTCTAPIGEQCNGFNDASCPADFECVQGCGSPVGYEDEPPPPYFCQLEGYTRNCPICLAKDTLIDTPLGPTPVQNLERGDSVWTLTASGERATGVILETSKTRVPSSHSVVELVFGDGRKLFVSAGHPSVDGRTVGDFSVGDEYDGAQVVSTTRVPYSDEYTYDLLPSGETGFYFANGVSLDTTLR